jgi:hypothetical protein
MRHKQFRTALVICLLGAIPFGLAWLRTRPAYRTPREPFRGSPRVRQRIDAAIEAAAAESLDQLVSGTAQFDDYFEGSFRYQGPGESGRIRLPLLFASRRFLRILEHLDSLPTEDARRECHAIRATWLEGHRKTIEACVARFGGDKTNPPPTTSAVGAYMGLVASVFVTANYCGAKDTLEWLTVVDTHASDLLDSTKLPKSMPQHARTMLSRVTELDPLIEINALALCASRDPSVQPRQRTKIADLLANLRRDEMAINGWNAKVGVFDLAAVNQGAWPDVASSNARIVSVYDWGNAVIGKKMYITDEDLRQRLLRDVKMAIVR